MYHFLRRARASSECPISSNASVASWPEFVRDNGFRFSMIQVEMCPQQRTAQLQKDLLAARVLMVRERQRLSEDRFVLSRIRRRTSSRNLVTSARAAPWEIKAQ